MKIHRPLVQAVCRILISIFSEGKYADKAIEQYFRVNPRLGKRDRAFIAENVYDIVRWLRLLRRVAMNNEESGAEGLSENDWGMLLAANLIRTWKATVISFDGWKTESFSEQFEVLKRENERRIQQSVPDWLDELGYAELGTRWETELQALNQPAPVVLRVNTLKTSKEELLQTLRLRGWNVSETPLAPDAIVLGSRGNVFLSPMFKNGFFEVQDAGSQCIAPFLDAKPGQRVIDACAGAGGKTLHLAAMMKNKGTIIALDTDPRKLDELRRRARRNGVQMVHTRLIESAKTIKRLYQSADALLLDVPCSGLGTLRRNPDAKWKLSPQFIENVKNTQARIIREYSTMLRPGGRMVYATCSVLPSENEAQVSRFLEEHPDWTLLKERNISPAAEGFDGFYMALLQRR